MTQQLRTANKCVYKHHSQKLVHQKKNVQIVSAVAIHLDIFINNGFIFKKRINYRHST